MKFRSRLFIGLALVLGCLGCATARRTDQRLIVALTTEPASLDPALSQDVASGRIIGYVYSTLVRFDPRMQLVGDLSTHHEVSPDGLVYTFHLRTDARFATGSRVEPVHVRASFERVLAASTASPRTWVLDRIVGAKDYMEGKAPTVAGIEVGADTVTLRLEKPFAPFLGFLAMPAASIVDPVSIATHGDKFWLKPSGSGPWQVRSFVKDGGIELVANPHHPVKPGASGIYLRAIKEPITLVTELELGNVDLGEVPASELPNVKAKAAWAGCLREQPGLNVFYLGLNCSKGLFKDVRLRRAAAHAIDAARIVRTVREGVAVASRGPIPPSLPGFDPTAQGLPYDAAKARALVKESSGTGRPAIRLLQSDAKDNLEVTLMLQAYLQRAGFDVELVSLEPGLFRQRVNGGDFDAFFYNWYADYADAENFLFPLFHSSRHGSGGNAPRYSNVQVDAWLEEAQRTPDDARRIQIYRTIEAQVVADAPRVFLFHRKQLWLGQPWVTGYTLFPVFNSSTMESVAVDPVRLAVGL